VHARELCRIAVLDAALFGQNDVTIDLGSSQSAAGDGEEREEEE